MISSSAHLPADRHIDTAQVESWLLRSAARMPDMRDIVEALAGEMNNAGLPVDRLTVGIPFLVPHILGVQLVWLPGQPVELKRFPSDPRWLRALEDSPIKSAYRQGLVGHYLVPAEAEPGEYPIIADMRRDGFKGYVVVPIAFSDGSYKVMTAATRRDGGFTDDHVAALREISVALSPVFEARAMRFLARTLLDIYVGPTASSRVLRGEVTRGEGTEIEAVIWFCDLRGSTEMSNTLGGHALIRMLNDFFGAVSDAVTENGGEVLKFIGDSVLAIFPCGDPPQANCPAIHEAERAARVALSRIAELNCRSDGEKAYEFDIGIALHVGRVFFGNVGAEDRLDFTVIGPAVNLAYRIESLSSQSGYRLLVSEEFANLSQCDCTPIGAFRFKGVDGWQNVFALPTQMALEENPTD